MTRSTMKFIKGMGLGLMAGCVAGVAGCCYMKHHRKGVKRNISKALKHMSELAETMNGMF